MEHLNYCRQAKLQAQNWLLTKKLNEWQMEGMMHLSELCDTAIKFILPVGGLIHDDVGFKALDEKESLKLPYPLIALEYPTGGTPTTKRIVFARELESGIAVTAVHYTKNLEAWIPTPECLIPKQFYLDRTQINEEGRVGIRFVCGERCEDDDYIDEVGALLSFLNTLQCSNVKIEKSHAKKSGRAVKTALPFDTYHILTIETQAKHGAASTKNVTGNSGRSPREHIRRGHIRKLSSGIKIWVNATTVNVGIPGLVTKSYCVK